MKKSFFDSYFQQQRFSIRKYSFGVVSILLGIFLVLFNGQGARADDVLASTSASVTNASISASQDERDLNLEKQDNFIGENNNENESSIDDSEENTVKNENAEESSSIEAANIEQKTIDVDSEQNNAEKVSNVSEETVTSGENNVNIESELDSQNIKEDNKSGIQGNSYSALSMLDTNNSLTATGSVAKGDDYPANLKNAAPDSVIDPWRLYNRECTSFTAYRLSSVNKFELPGAYGNGAQWGGRARREGYIVDMNPAKGSVAWVDDGNYGHVAWVSDVIGDNVEIEEYNYRWNHNYNRRIVSKTAFTGFIHFKDLKLEPEKAVVKGKIEIQNQNDKAGTFDVIVTNVSSNYDIREVQLPIWSVQNDQDDIIWYRAQKQGDGSYKTSVKISDHKNDRGTYNIHLYYVLSNGQQIGVMGTQTTVTDGSTETPTGTITVKNQDDKAGTFDVVISNIVCPNGLKEIRVPIWSVQNDQDDIIWYTATKQDDGTYKVSVKISDHKNDRGVYNIHLYYSTNNGEFVGIGGTQIKIKELDKNQPKGTIAIKNIDNQVGTFDVVISNVFNQAGVKEVKVPVWSEENGQDDIIWYTAIKQNDGTYKVSVKASDHKNSQGQYNVHLYYVQDDGKLVGIGGTKTEVHFITRPSIPDSGTYTFTNRASIKSEPKVSAPEIAYYDAGNQVYYDKLILSDGHYWISYVSYSGSRRYISIT